MKIRKITIENYRLLKNFSLDLEEELSLVVGKNNTGKTSFLSVLNKFINASERNKFSYDDFNLDFREELYRLIKSPKTEEDYRPAGIKLKLFIDYNEKDNLANISRVMMDLDPENNTVVLGFEYTLSADSLNQLRLDYSEFEKQLPAARSQTEAETETETETETDNKTCKYDSLSLFLRDNQSSYFTTHKKSIEYSKTTNSENDEISISLDDESAFLKNLISLKSISAKRDVTNREQDGTLSAQTSLMYKKLEASEEQKKTIKEFKEKLSSTDQDLTTIYSSLFGNVIDKVKKFGGIKIDDSIIEIISTLQHRELLAGNTTVTYKQCDNTLPENYNGLGYMNLISIIFEIEILMNEFKKKKDQKPADINLLFIEEPEAHTHPQMQYIFIKNIKALLKEGIRREDHENRDLQYIISTHSSHIVSESSFDDIKYLKKDDSNSVTAKNLRDLKDEYAENKEERYFKFLKQYLTLNRAELFFADKAILIEGDTERILLPAMMKKIDQATSSEALLSQNISIVEVGAHSHIFEKFINFIGIEKTLIITDIDSCSLQPVEDNNGKPKMDSNGKPKKTWKKCSPSSDDAKGTTNYALLNFHSKGNDDLDYFKSLSPENKVLMHNGKQWVPDKDGTLFIAYQVEEAGNYPRSFEDAFFHINREFFTKSEFHSLTQASLKKFRSGEISSYDFAESGVNKKPPLAIEILLNSDQDEDGNDFSNWNVPQYIEEGLEWLAKN